MAFIVDSETVDVFWSDNSAVEDGYAISIDTFSSDLQIIATTEPNATSIRISFPHALIYSYFVVALKDGGYSDRSDSYAPTW